MTARLGAVAVLLVVVAVLGSALVLTHDAPPVRGPARTLGGRQKPGSTAPAPARNEAAPTAALGGGGGGAPGSKGATSFSFVSPSLGWVLAGTPCGAGAVCAAVLRTVDGGRHWQPRPSPTADVGVIAAANGAYPACVRGPCVSQIRFANARDGYVFGPALFVTTDGGRRWRRGAGPAVVALEAAGPNVFRVLANGSVQSAPAGSTAWTTLTSPHLHWVQLVRGGSRTLYLRSHSPQSHSAPELWRSTNAGATWQSLGDPCIASAYGKVLAMAATGHAVAVVCASLQFGPQSAGYHQGVAVSADAGATFGAVHDLPGLQGSDGTSAPLGMAMATPHVLAINSSEGGVQTSFDGGTTWTTTMPEPSAYTVGPGSLPATTAAGTIGFETATAGHVITPSATISTTTDGGRSWTSYHL